MTTHKRRTVADMLADPRLIAGADGTLSKNKIDQIVHAHSAGMRKALEDGGVPGRSPNRLPIYPPSGRVTSKDDSKSIGESFIGSDGYRNWVERFPTGGPSGPGEYRSDPVEIALSMRDASRTAEVMTASTSRRAHGP